LRHAPIIGQKRKADLPQCRSWASDRNSDPDPDPDPDPDLGPQPPAPSPGRGPELRPGHGQNKTKRPPRM